MVLSQPPQSALKCRFEVLLLFVMTIHLDSFFSFSPQSSKHIFVKLCIFFLAVKLFLKLLTRKYPCHAILSYPDSKCGKSSVPDVSLFMEIQENQLLQTDGGLAEVHGLCRIDLGFWLLIICTILRNVNYHSFYKVCNTDVSYSKCVSRYY